jgi:DNA-binding response OmpR family regulator
MPVIVLTARGTLDARISGLDKGADDYLAKPFSPDELMARLRAVLRRNGSFQGREVVCANLSFDIDNQGLRIDGESVALSQREGALLALLMRRAGLVVTKRLAEDQLFGRATRWAPTPSRSMSTACGKSWIRRAARPRSSPCAAWAI